LLKPSAEPTTTGAERVVIVGYNRASPASKSATLRTGFLPYFFPLFSDPYMGPGEKEGRKPGCLDGCAQVSGPVVGGSPPPASPFPSVWKQREKEKMWG